MCEQRWTMRFCLIVFYGNELTYLTCIRNGEIYRVGFLWMHQFRVVSFYYDLNAVSRVPFSSVSSIWFLHKIVNVFLIIRWKWTHQRLPGRRQSPKQSFNLTHEKQRVFFPKYLRYEWKIHARFWICSITTEKQKPREENTSTRWDEEYVMLA